MATARRKKRSAGIIESLTPRPQISTKVRLEPEDMDEIPSAILRSLEASLTRLRLPKIELFQLHNHIGTTLGGRAPRHAANRCSAGRRRRYLRPP